MVRRVLGLLTIAFLAGALVAPSAALAAGKVITVGPPSPGGDDTAAVQTALNGCIGAPPGCVVQLRAGTYHTSQLYADNFRGTLKGMGKGHTTIASLSVLTVNWYDWNALPPTGQCIPNTPGPGGNPCKWAHYIAFDDGIVAISDLTIDTSATRIGPYVFFGTNVDIAFALNFEGLTRIDASVDRVDVHGGFDLTGGSFGSDFNTGNGINYVEVPGASGGSFAVRDSSVERVQAAITPGPVINGQVTMTGNTISGVDIGMVVNGPSGTFEIANNRIRADNPDPVEQDHVGIIVAPSGMETGLAARFSIHDNAITAVDTCGCNMLGMVLADAVGGLPHWFRAAVLLNTVSLPGTYILDDNVKEGIETDNIAGDLISGNTIKGTVTGTLDAIALWSNDPSWLPSTGNAVLANNVSGIQIDPANAWSGQILLDPGTASNLVVCLRPTDTVADYGTGNKVVGCDPPGPTTKVATRGAPSLTHILSLEGKPFLP
ncbi:MAG TPA: hypothetical protein VEI48_07900 [Candidatus Sulfotelmatobacter sp.]|nr:hypothetical protein [Candidatus Sulfotelmatobacter sp.]